jgi:hypothetical protein
MWKKRIVAVAVFAGGLNLAGSAFAVDVNFCKSGDSCVDGLVKNKAAVIVTRTHITQEGKHGCEKIEKTIEKNLTKGGAKIDLKIDKECRYKVRFTTTDGCTGDKEGQISSSEAEEGKTAAYLTGGCGTLNVKIAKP